MVLFNDTEPPKQPTAFSKTIKWVFRFVILGIILVLFFIGSLHLLQGSGDTQRNGLQQALSELTNTTADIKVLNDFQLFPQLVVDASGIVLKDKETADLIMRMRGMRFAAPGSVVFSYDAVVNDLYIENMSLYRNGLPAVTVDTARIEKNQSDQTAELMVEGADREGNWSYSMPVTYFKGTGEAYDYFELSGEKYFEFEKENGTSINGHFLSHEEKLYVSGVADLPETNQFSEKLAGQDDICFTSSISIENGQVLLNDTVLKSNEEQLFEGNGSYTIKDGFVFEVEPVSKSDKFLECEGDE